MRILAIILSMFAVTITPVLSAAGDVIFICNPSIKSSQLTKKEISKIFFGKKIEWEDKSRITVVLQKNSAVHNSFLEEYIHQSPSRFDNYWKRQIFTGKASSLKIFGNDRKVIKFVSETKGAIGYVSPQSGLDSVKTIGVK